MGLRGLTLIELIMVKGILGVLAVFFVELTFSLHQMVKCYFKSSSKLSSTGGDWNPLSDQMVAWPRDAVR